MVDFNKHKRLQEAYDYLIASEIVGTQLDVATKMKMQRSTVNAALNGKDGYVTDSFLRKFSRTFDLNARYLILGEGKLYEGNRSNNVTVAENSGTINNGSTVNNTYKKETDTEHDELIKIRTERESIIRIIENISDPNTALSAVASVLGANRQ